jgi:hypothetical protein
VPSLFCIPKRKGTEVKSVREEEEWEEEEWEEEEWEEEEW